ELMERGLHGTKLVIEADEAHGRPAGSFEGERLGKLVQVLNELQDPLVILERRGLNLSTLLANAKDGVLPMYRVLLGGRMHWLHSADEMDRFRQAEQARLGRDLVVADEGEPGASATGGDGAAA